MAIRKHVIEIVALAVVMGMSFAATPAQGQAEAVQPAVEQVPAGPSEADCAARADRAARDSTGVAGGAMRGAVGGAAFGVIVGDSRKATKRGAALGAVVGGASAAHQKDDVYKRVYDECMRAR
jgi:hypothetical protein